MRVGVFLARASARINNLPVDGVGECFMGEEIGGGAHTNQLYYSIFKHLDSPHIHKEIKIVNVCTGSTIFYIKQV